MIIKKPLLSQQRTSLPRGTTSIYRKAAAFPVPTDRKRNIGRTRLRLLQISAEPLGKEFGAVLLLPCTNRQLSIKRMGARTGFRHRVYFY